MVKASLVPASMVDGFRIEEQVHRGGMATLWRVSRNNLTIPMLMKVPRIGEGEDPAAIVSFEMEQMILPRISGIHAPAFVASGDFDVQP
jgi:eukaryotic-like serine/threonine-protein kinase